MCKNCKNRFLNLNQRNTYRNYLLKKAFDNLALYAAIKKRNRDEAMAMFEEDCYYSNEFNYLI